MPQTIRSKFTSRISWSTRTNIFPTCSSSELCADDRLGMSIGGEGGGSSLGTVGELRPDGGVCSLVSCGPFPLNGPFVFDLENPLNTGIADR